MSYADLTISINPGNPHRTLVSWKDQPVGFLRKIRFEQEADKTNQTTLVFSTGYLRFPSRDVIETIMTEMRASGILVSTE